MTTRKVERSKLPESLKTLFVVFIGLFIAVFVIVFLQILGFVPKSDVFTFTSGLLAGIFGILIGFSLDRFSDEQKDIQTKDAFLNLIREELTDIKNSIYPEENRTLILYTDIWDSVISSGVIRLLITEQVLKLSRVYKSIKGASFEAEWIRRNSEELDSLSYGKAEPQVAVADKLMNNVVRHKRRMKDISEEIDKVLKEDWWKKQVS
jgi:hypothetical protein